MSKFSSYNSATGKPVWTGTSAGRVEVESAIRLARQAATAWAKTSFEMRSGYLEKFKEQLQQQHDLLVEVISQETGKPLWEARTEVAAMIGKIPISIEAYQNRCQSTQRAQTEAISYTRHKPHGVVAILGPFNFPGHLPNGHIVPALLAGNTVVFKPSEATPFVGQIVADAWRASGLPPGVFNLLQGQAETGKLVAQHPGIDGLFFTGSWRTGQFLAETFAARPEKILALEMGGNNPLVVMQVSDLKAAVLATIQSAYLTAGQRCSCARRLILLQGSFGNTFLELLKEQIVQLRVGHYTANPEPFMGPLIHSEAAEQVLDAVRKLKEAGGLELCALKALSKTLITPGLMDVTAVKNRPDVEIFGPFLQVIRVPTFAAAIQEANHTAYGLTAGLLSDDPAEYAHFYSEVRAGIINWNMPLTGASSTAPFGGIGQSGNFRPSAYYAADYCSYPVASMESATLKSPTVLPPGIQG